MLDAGRWLRRASQEDGLSADGSGFAGALVSVSVGNVLFVKGG
jgi:hypothetical protein